MVETLARAMQHAHDRGIVHRDLKPANVPLTACGLASEGAKPQAAIPKITDFGLASKLDDSGQTREGAVLGAPNCMAPEQASGRGREVRPAADVWAMGALLYECVNGRPTFLGATTLDTLALVMAGNPVSPRHLQPTIPRDLETICLKCLEKTPRSAIKDEMQFWDVASGRLLHTILTGGIHDAVFSPDGRVLATSGVDGMVKLWDAASGRPVDTLRRHVGRVFNLSFAPEGKRLASAGFDSTVRVWDVDVRQAAPVLQQGGKVNHVRFGPDSQTLCVANYVSLKVWDTASATGRLTVPVPAGQTIMGASPDASLFITGDQRPSTYQKVQLRHGRSGQLLRVLTTGQVDRGKATFSPDIKLLALRASDFTIVLFETATSRRAATLRGHRHQLTALAFSADSKRLASGTARDVRVWDVTDGTEVLRLEQEPGGTHCLAFDPQGRRLATGGNTPRVTVWDLPNRRTLLSFTANRGSVEDVCFSPDGQRLATAGSDSVVRLWEMETGQEVQTLTGHQKTVRHVCFSPDGRHLASGGEDGTVRLWTTSLAEDVLFFEGTDEPFVSAGGAARAAAPATGAGAVGRAGGFPAPLREADSIGRGRTPGNAALRGMSAAPGSGALAIRPGE